MGFSPTRSILKFLIFLLGSISYTYSKQEYKPLFFLNKSHSAIENGRNLRHIVPMKHTNEPIGAWLSKDDPDIITNPVWIAMYNNIGGPHNALWVEGNGINEGKHYWKFHFPYSSINASVGLSNKHYLLKARKTKCLCYNGHLNNGNKVLVKNFGMPISSNSTTVGMLVNYLLGRIFVYFDINGVQLGLAYDVPQSILPDAYPIVQFYNPGSVTCHKNTILPLSTERHVPVQNGYQGRWKFKSLFLDRSDHYEYLRDNSPNPKKNCLIIQSTDKMTIYANIEGTYKFDFEKIYNRWKPNITDYVTVESFRNCSSFNAEVLYILQQPDIIRRIGDRLEIRRRNKIAEWYRLHNLPEPFLGNPFQQHKNKRTTGLLAEKLNQN